MPATNAMFATNARREKETLYSALLREGVKTLEILGEDFDCRNCGKPFTRFYLPQKVCLSCVEAHVRLSAEAVRDSLLEERRRRLERMGLAGLLTTMTLDSFVVDEQPEAHREALRFTVSWPAVAGLVLLGKPGTGKTHLAVGCLLSLAESGIEGRYVHLPEATAALRRAEDWSAESRRIIGPLFDTPCLVIDDAGREKSSDAIVEQLDALVNRRWRDGMPTIMTANQEATEFFGDGKDKAGWLSPAAASRIGSGASVIRLRDGDRRMRGFRGTRPIAHNADPTVGCETCQGAGWVVDAAIAVGRADRIRECPTCQGRRF